LERISREDWWGASETALLTGIDSNLWDGQQSIGWGNGLRANYQYDDQGRLTSIETKQANNPFDSYRLQYDKKDQINRIDQNNQLNKQQQTYQYDKAGRLTASERSGAQNKSWSYEYDQLGNRLKKGGTGNKQALSYGPGNKLLAINQKALKYNKAGSAELIPSDIGIKRYEYNAEQRPVKFYLNDKLTAEYAYNGFGERVKKTVYNGDKKQTIFYLYTNQRIAGEVDESGQVSNQYIYNLGRPLIKLEGKSVYSIVSDHLGTPRLMVDDEGDTVWAASYDPFGQADIVREDKVLNIRFPGQYFDEESGAHYNYFRDYDP
ncbi:MAG: RHS domain-containing protein, partial [Cellvibrionaceae bacterium]|nr:RHS domain-containing protein [Cellvibrionaceae bacterium]